MASVNIPCLEMLSKNLSYEGNYHRKIYYAKLVYDRVRQRRVAIADWKAFNRAFNVSFEYGQGLSSSDSLPDLLTVSSPSGGSNNDRDLPDTSDVHQLRRCSSSEILSFDACDPSIEQIDIKPFLAGSDSSSSLPPSSPAGSVMSMAGSTDADELDFLDLFKEKSKRRSSSLKSRDSKSGSDQIRKKSVRFADAMGLDLHSVKHILDKDEPPVLPRHALQDLKKGLEEAHLSEGTRYMSALFTQPGLSSDFLDRVRIRNVALEKCLVDGCNRTVTGTIRVANICYNKVVTVRYTLNNWVTFNDVAASYVLNSNDGATDQFAFTIILPISMTVGSRLEFALKFTAVDLGQAFWDSNFSSNYQIICYAKAIPTHNLDSTWMHFL